MFDIYLPTVVLSPVLFYFQPEKLDPSEQAIFASLVFITTLLGRPIGALAFGVVADRFGRRMASITSVAGFGLITLYAIRNLDESAMQIALVVTADGTLVGTITDGDIRRGLLRKFWPNAVRC